MENYFEQKLNLMERSIARQITDGSSNFRMEIGGHLDITERTFGKLNNGLRNVVTQVAGKFNENDGRNAKIDGLFTSVNGAKFTNAKKLGGKKRKKENKEESK